MSNLQELKNKLCPNGVEFRKLGEICNFIRNGIQYKYMHDIILKIFTSFHP